MYLPFTPTASTTATLTTTQGTVNVMGRGRNIRLVNNGSGNAYIGFYESGTTAPTLTPTTAMLVSPGAVEIFACASDTTQIAVLGDATGTSLNVTRGEGA